MAIATTASSSGSGSRRSITAQHQPSRLLSLPRELRDHIYDLVLTAPARELLYHAASNALCPDSNLHSNPDSSASASASASSSQSSASANFFALRRTSRQLRAETPTQALRQNSVVFGTYFPPQCQPHQTPVSELSHFLSHCTPHQRLALRGMTLRGPQALYWVRGVLEGMATAGVPGGVGVRVDVDAEGEGEVTNLIRLASRLLIKAWFVRARYRVELVLVGATLALGSDDGVEDEVEDEDGGEDRVEDNDNEADEQEQEEELEEEEEGEEGEGEGRAEMLLRRRRQRRRRRRLRELEDVVSRVNAVWDGGGEGDGGEGKGKEVLVGEGEVPGWGICW
ncbi:uncharacterized protein K452DRAFT_343354 [Aplosporella prunicola CBS 121167]|uniref:Uncharacterized protein n=1 Tax=Aplosporella prunicola CBS 121167 TaxID=1176127 RepID=A0A6A6BL67_9PEZI|nr:uncharacterized protein K452DRAFT_343354 [Aplosporella prunicola CBS 121167]KAF2144860.1 hypothetical protein K452DRAFT_343354 [Aplosporella prunicola CBS 121167]